MVSRMISIFIWWLSFTQITVACTVTPLNNRPFCCLPNGVTNETGGPSFISNKILWD